MNKKIKEIAEFDGWVISEYQPFSDTVLYAKDEEYDRLDRMPYLTNLNALHRVALDLMDKVSSENMIHRLHNAMLFRPINGQYTDLVDAVYDAIVYLKKHNSCQPK